MFEIVEDAEVKLCKDCKHFNADMPQCRAEGNRKTPNYVHGGFNYRWESAQPVRLTESDCGPSASWFEPK